MANDVHLAKLAESIEAWNAWRREHPDLRPDLSKVNFRGANLRDANLSDANLSDAKLRDADLKGADLGKADLREADLSGANLTRANLEGAYLYRADLIGSKLIGANLNDANVIDATLIGADLSTADLGGADLRKANLMNADLSAVKGLDCDSLQRANNWQLAIRNSELDCGEPRRPDDDEDPVEIVPIADPPAEAAAKPHYQIKTGPDGRPAMDIDPNRTRLRRPDVSRDQQLAAAADLEVSTGKLVAAVRAALAGFMATDERPGKGNKVPPPDIAEIIDQIFADAGTLILQSKAPAPDLAIFHRFKSLVGELDPMIKAASTDGGTEVTAAVVGKIDFFLEQFGN
tara:strand:- start:829 stop:1863 length:1035 start_codon:yes stop_codon:yes gene_type:complete